MNLSQTTPVPNGLFDKLPELSSVELRCILWINRSTLGWVDKSTGKRKTRDWISSSQFAQKAGLSERSVTTAIEGLLDKRLIYVTDLSGTDLSNPAKRKFASQIYYQLASKDSNPICNTSNNCSQPKQLLQTTPQKVLSTKSILQKKGSPHQKLTDSQRYEQIKHEEVLRQERRNSWL